MNVNHEKSGGKSFNFGPTVMKEEDLSGSEFWKHRETLESELEPRQERSRLTFFSIWLFMVVLACLGFVVMRLTGAI